VALESVTLKPRDIHLDAREVVDSSLTLARANSTRSSAVNLKTPDTQAAQSSVHNAMRPLDDKELNAIVGGLRVTIVNKKGEKIVIDM
jgi:bacteriocin-like protein